MFFASLKIFLNLFKFQLFKMMILVFISFFILTIIPIVINSYNQSLENSLATKQPHLIVRYIDEKQTFTPEELSEMKDIIYKSINDISIINAFVKENMFVKLKSYGYNLSEYSGYVDTIGLSSNSYPLCYDFNSILPVMLNDYGFKITGLEVFDIFKNDKNTMFFNYSLYNSIKPLVTYEAKFGMKFFIENKIAKKEGNFLGVVEDFYDKPILYMNYKVLNKIMGYDKNHISGFMINIEDQKKLKNVQAKLEIFFNKNTKSVTITNWREVNKKQNDIFNIFIKVGEFLKWIILILSTSAVNIYLYKILLLKQPQLRLLNILGLRLIYITNITISLLIAATVVLSSYTAHFGMLFLYENLLNLDLKVNIEFYIVDILFAYAVLISFVIILIKNLFNQNYNIFK